MRRSSTRPAQAALVATAAVLAAATAALPTLPTLPVAIRHVDSHYCVEGDCLCVSAKLPPPRGGSGTGVCPWDGSGVEVNL